MIDLLVAGAGVSGLWAALVAARRGARVRVIERSARAGGLAASEDFRGIPCDLGSHRLHPAALTGPLFRELHEENPLLFRPRRGVLLLSNRRAPYPPSALSMALALGPRTTVSLVAGLARRPDRRRSFLHWERDRADGAGEVDIGFEAFVRNRVGDAAYRAFYRPYALKVWGIPPAELSQSVAKKRVSATDPLRLLRGLPARAISLVRGERAERADHFVYPEGGISSVVGFLERKLAEHGVRVETGASFEPSRRGPPVLFAGDLSDLVATPLEHRGIYLVYVALPIPRVSEVETYYSPDPRYWFGRVSELSNYSPRLSRPHETILCVEIPEGAWGKSLDFSRGERLSTLLRQLEEAGIVPRGVRPIEVRQRYLPRVYPLYRRGFRADWRDAMARIAAMGNVFPFGRQALFLHVNLDHCAVIAEDVVTHVLSSGSSSDWVRSAERYLELRVRD